MIDQSNKENLSSNLNIVIPKPISTWKRSNSNLNGRDLKVIAPDSSSKLPKQNPIIKIKRGQLGNMSSHFFKIEEAFQIHQTQTTGNRFSHLESDSAYKSGQKLNLIQQQQQDHFHQYTQMNGNKIQQNNINSHLENEQSTNILYNLNQKMTQNQNSSSSLRIENPNSKNSLSNNQSINKPYENNTRQNFQETNQHMVPTNSFHINLPSTITTRQQNISSNHKPFQLQRTQSSTLNNLMREEIKTFENLNGNINEQGVFQKQLTKINRNPQIEQDDNILEQQSNISNINGFNSTAKNTNNNLSAFFEQSTVCFNSTETDEANNFIRVFDQHMQEKQDLFKIQLETNELLGEVNNNPIRIQEQYKSRKMNCDNTILFHEKAFLGNACQYQEAEYIIFKKNDFNRLLLKQEAVQELLVQQQLKIKALESQLNCDTGSERIEQKQQILQQIQQDLENNDRITRYTSRGSDYSSKHGQSVGQFNSIDTDFRNYKQKINNQPPEDFSMNRILQTEKDEDFKNFNNITDILNIQTDESHSLFDVSMNARKSSNVTKYSSNPNENSNQANIPRLQLQQNDANKLKPRVQNMFSTFGQGNQNHQDNEFNKQKQTCDSTQNMFKKKINYNEEQQFQYAPENMSQLRSSIADQSRIMDENEEGTIRQSIKETCRNRIVSTQNADTNSNCFIDGVETFRAKQSTTPSIQTLQRFQNTQSLRSFENTLGSQTSKPPKNPAAKKIFTDKSEFSTVQSFTSTAPGKGSGFIVNTDRSHNPPQLRSKSTLGIREQSNQYNIIEKQKMNTKQSDEKKYSSEKQQTSYSTLSSNNKHHFRSHGEFDNNVSLNRYNSEQNLKQQSQDQNCAIF